MLSVTIYHLRRGDGRICKIYAAFTGEFALVILRSCDLAEVNTEVHPENFTENPVNCFVCISEGAI